MPARTGKHDAAAREFHFANPHVMSELIGLARFVRSQGHRRIGVDLLWNRLRWSFEIETTGNAFKLNNNFRSWYAREIMRRCPDLDGLFELREAAAA